LHLSSLKKW